MNTPTVEKFTTPQQGYIAFDAMSLRQLIVDRLNEQKVFTDQNFIGSNLASIIDIVSYSYHTLIYYLNKTSTESMFTEAQLYENINRIVKTLDYSPQGYQTSTLAFSASVQDIDRGIYTIPRYTTVTMNGIPYSFNEDISFTKTIPYAVESLLELSKLKLLYQGQYQEYPVYNATGESNETIILNVKDIDVDHSNIDVYVKTARYNIWQKYYKTQNLYLDDGHAYKYELRLNGNMRYEIKFGDNINGKKLEENDQVAIYYLMSNGTQGVVGEGFETSENRRYDTPQYLSILSDVNTEQLNYLTSKDIFNLQFKSVASSTLPKTAESVDSIRQLAPALYRSQYRLVTTGDFEAYIKANFSSLVNDIKVLNNWSYVSEYLKYFYEIGITTPYLTERALFNQVLYSDSCNFNNIYLVIVPRANAASTNTYLAPSQKEFISSTLLSTKMTTAETVFIDPVYKALSFGVRSYDGTVDVMSRDQCVMVVKKSSNVNVSNDFIINSIVHILENALKQENVTLEHTINIRELTQYIYDIPGVESFKVVRGDTGESANELSLLIWNPVYPENDAIVTQNNHTFKSFEFPYLEDVQGLQDKIKIVTSYGIYEPTEY